MDEIWERAVETALDGQTDVGSVRTLTLDGVVKCVHGRLPPPSLFEKFRNLQHLSIANIGVSSLEQFPRLQNLEKLILSDNRIAGGLEFLVAAGLNSLRDLDLSNNRIQDINDLRPLAELRLVSLDLYECPVTRVKDYRSRVFGLIKSLKYLDKMDAEENERPESDEEEDEEEDEDDPGSGEIDGEERPNGMNNGHRAVNDGIVDVDEDEESDADEEETEISRGANGMARGVLHHQSNGFRIEGVDGEEYDDEYGDGDGDGEGEDDEENDSVDEIDEEGDDDEDVVEVHEIEDSDDEEDGVEDDEDEDDDDEEDVDEEEVDNDDGNFGGQENTGRLAGTEGEIDGHEQGEDDEDDNGETGEEEQGVEEEGDYQVDEEAEDEEEDCDSGYLVQPVAQAEGINPGLGEMPQRHDSEDADLAEYIEEDDDEDGEVQELPPSSSQKRKRDGGENDSDDGGIGDEDEEDDDIVECTRSSKSSKHQK